MTDTISIPPWRIAETNAPLPPEAPGLPLAGNTLSMLNDPLSFLVKMYRELGPVYRVKMGLQRYTVLAGLEANQFLSREADGICSSKVLFGNMAKALGSDIMLTILEGDDHRYMRRVMRPGFARSAMEPYMAQVIGIVRDEVARWQVGQDVPVVQTVRRIVADQIGIMTTGFPLGDHFDDLQFWLNNLMNVYVVKLKPKAVLLDPRFTRAKARLEKFGQEILDYHVNVPHGDARPRDYVDEFLETVRPDGEKFTPGDMFQFSVGPYIAGMDTVASSISFFVYTLLKHPDVLARVLPEVDALFADGDAPALSAFRKAEVFHAAAVETLRMYPVAPYTPRTAMQPFEFMGYRVDAGTELMIANTVTHYLDEYFPEPERFDVDRWMGGQANPPTGAFAPYSLGAHTCLGAGLAEAQMMVTMAALLRCAKLELPTPDYQVSIKTLPLPNPGRDFAVKVVEKRRI